MIKAALRHLWRRTSEPAMGGALLSARRVTGSDRPGQAIVILALTFFGIAVVIGLMTDMAIAIVAQAHLRRGVDSAAIAAATQVREGADFKKIGQFAAEYIRMNIDPTNTSLDWVRVERCVSGSENTVERYEYRQVAGEAIEERPVQLTAPTNADMCVGNTTLPRKQIYVEGRVFVEFAFLRLVNWNNTTLTANATSEAAAIDLILVINTNELMAQFTPPLRGDGLNAAFGPAFNPDVNPACNLQAGSAAALNPEDGNGKCRPFWDAKQAAKNLIDTLYRGVDRVAIVTYDLQAYTPLPLTVVSPTDARASTTTPSTGVYAALDNLVLKDESHQANIPGALGATSNPMNGLCNSNLPGNCPAAPSMLNSLVSGCAGCGVRVAANVLKAQGRPEALWVIVFLSDGYVNASDVPQSVFGQATGVDAAFPNGFCFGSATTSSSLAGTWNSQCLTPGFDYNNNGTIDDPSGGIEGILRNPAIRSCGPYHNAQANCPPGAVYVGLTGISSSVSPMPPTAFGTLYYDPLDYARDMVDSAALTTNCASANCNPTGAWPWPVGRDLYNQSEIMRNQATLNTNEILIYSIGFGATVTTPPAIGESLLRYMAAVGDDGDRTTNPCSTVPSGGNCGNYYFAPDAGALGPVFEDISRRIFTRLTR